MTAEYLKDGLWQALPPLLTYRLTHTDGGSADSFALSFPTDRALLLPLRACTELRAVENGAIVFRGVIDEVEAAWGERCVTTLCGRGLAARLMDSQCRGAEFFQADLNTVLDRFVRPYGISQIYAPGAWQAKLWSVGTGTSCYRALQGFCLLSGAPQPRFSRDGTLMIARSERRFSIGETAPVSAAVRLCRYGVLARQEVADLTGGGITAADFSEAGAYGITARHVATRSGSFTHVTERSARQRIVEAARELLTVEAVLPGTHPAQCCDIASVSLPSLGLAGEFTVAETCRQFDGSRELTRLRLRRKDG